MKLALSTILLIAILLTGCGPTTAPTPVTIAGVLQALLLPPYDNCVANSSQTPSEPSGSNNLLDNGFSTASSLCDAKRGAINYSIVAFGGKKGSVLDSPSQEATASGDMVIRYKAPSTGSLTVVATIAVNSKTGAAAGNATILPDFKDAVADFLLPEQLDAFQTFAKGLIFGTGAGLRTDADLSVDTGTFQNRVTTLVGGHGFGATFPVPPWSQNGTFNSEQVVISLTAPVTQGQTVQITTGISTSSRVYGWASTYWNLRKNQESYVTTVALYLPASPTTYSSQTPTSTQEQPTAIATTLTPAFTSTPAPTNTPNPVSLLRGTVTQLSNCRYGPDWPYLYKYGVGVGTKMEVIGRDADGNWLHVQGVGAHNPCWIKAAQIQVDGDVMSLPDAYPVTTGLPISPFFEQITITRNSNSGGSVSVEWLEHTIRSDLGTEQGIEYIVEVWTCVDGKPNFSAIGTNDTSASFQIDDSCGMTSHADVIGEDKEGFSVPAMIALR